MQSISRPWCDDEEDVCYCRLLRTVMDAPQSYFSTTDTGTTLNRFSADTSMIDRRLPNALQQVGQYFFRVISQWLLLGVVQPFMTITLPFTAALVSRSRNLSWRDVAR